MPDHPDDPGNLPGDGADAEESKLEEWVGGPNDTEEAHDWDYDANLPDSVIPQLNNDGIQRPPTGEKPEGEAAAEANEAAKEKKQRLDAAWERLVAGIGLFIFLGLIGHGCTQVFVDNVCGGLYDVFLRVIAFNNFQVTSDQLLTNGGNPFQSATG